MSVTAVDGFEAAGIASGIKPSGAPDLSLVATANREPVSAAGVFTTNLASAAPVQISRLHLADGRAAAVVLNSGNANAATGDAGRADALRMCELAADGLGVATSDVLVCSTGLIGIPMPMAPVETGVPKLVVELAPGAEAGHRAAQALMTTDTMRKESVADADLGDGRHIRVGGMAKGAAMLAPSMATMLAVLTTDAQAEPAALHAALERAVDTTFNALVVDACTSTNDTVLLLANGAAGGAPVGTSGHAYHALVEAVTAVCDDLARQMAADAEGATKLVHLIVRGARSSEEARRAARGVASSQLVQCSLYGADPVLGSSALGAGRERRLHRARARRHRVQRRHGLSSRHRRVARRDRAAGVDGASATSRSCATSTSGAARRRCASPTSRTRTSTRTWGRADGRRRSGHRPRRGAAVHPRVLGQDGRDQVRRARDGRPGARGALRAGRRAHAPRRHPARRRARRGSADQRPDAAPRARSPSSSTACASPMPRPSTSCAWRSSAR